MGTAMTLSTPTTILLIEDSLSDARLIEELLRRSPRDSFTVLNASTLAKGLELLSANSVDVILLDLGLPDSDGFATFTAVSKQARQLPIIVLTVEDDEALGERLLQEGAQRFIAKDVLTLGLPYARVFTRMIRFAIEQKQAEAALAKSELKYRELVDTANVIILTADPTLTITYCNDYTLKLLGYKRDEFVGQPVMGTLLPATESSGRDLAQMARDILDHPERYAHNRNEVTTKDGRRLLVEWTNAPQHDDEGTYLGILSTGINITEREHLKHASILNEIIHAINEASTLPVLYERTLTTIFEQLHFESGLVATVSGDGTLTVEYAHNHSPAFIKAIDGLAIDESAFTRALYQQRELVMWDTMPSDTTSSRLGVKGAALGIPFVSEGKAVGHVSFHAAEERSFTFDERRLFQTIGLELGTAVTKLKAQAQAKEHARQQSILTHVISAGNRASDLKAACAAMLGTALDLLPLYYGCIFLLDQQHPDAVTLQSAHGYTDTQLQWAQRIPLTQRLTARVMAGTPLFYDDYQAVASPDAQSMNNEVQSMTFIPLMSGDTVLGFYNLGSRGAQYCFTDEEQKLLTAIGKEAGTVIARLLAETATRTQARYTALLNKIILYGNTTTDAQDFSKYIVDVLIADLGYDAADVRLLRANDGIAELVAARGQPAKFVEQYRSMSIDDPVLRAAYRGEPYFPVDSTQPLDAVARTAHVASIGVVPLVVGERVIGNIGVTSKASRPFSLGEQALLVAIGRETGTVVARLQAEEALKESETRYRSLVERNFDGVIIHSDGIIRYANDAAARIAKVRSSDELVGLPVFEISSPQYRELLKQRVQEIYRTHKSSDLIEIQMNACDGTTVDIELSGAFITYEGTPAIYVVARDISERKQMEAQLKQYADHLEAIVEERTVQLKNAERLAGIGETAAMIGHDLRNPLQGLQYIVDLQKLRFERLSSKERNTEDWQNEQALFDRISEQVCYMDKIVGDLQDYARPLEPERAVVTVDTLISDALQSLPHAKNVAIVTDVSDLIVEADPHLMHRVFSNLFLNAMQAMPDGGTLTIGASTTDGFVSILVSDTGVGIPAEMRDKLFSPLTTGKAKGTGLGLAVVRRIVEAHDGTITFDSEEGRGTTFTIALPQAAE